MFHFRSLSSRIRSRITGRSFSDLASETRLLDGPVVWETKPAIHLSDDLARVTGHYDTGSRSRDLDILAGKPLRQGASVARLYRNAVIADGCVMVPGGLTRIAPAPRDRGEAEEIGEAVLCSTYVTERYFGHWLHDGLAHELWATDQGVMPLVLPPPLARVHEEGYRAITGQRPRVTGRARVDRLWVLEDHELTASRVERIERLRGIIRKSATGGPSKVFLARGHSGAGRSLVNEAEIVAHLRSRGFAVLRPESETPRTIVDTLKDADVVVGVEGSSFAHAVMAGKRGSTWAVINPPSRFNMVMKVYADVIGVRFAFTVGEDAGGTDIYQPVDRLDALLEKLG